MSYPAVTLHWKTKKEKFSTLACKTHTSASHLWLLWILLDQLADSIWGCGSAENVLGSQLWTSSWVSNQAECTAANGVLSHRRVQEDKKQIKLHKHIFHHFLFFLGTPEVVVRRKGTDYTPREKGKSEPLQNSNLMYYLQRSLGNNIKFRQPCFGRKKPLVLLHLTSYET